MQRHLRIRVLRVLLPACLVAAPMAAGSAPAFAVVGAALTGKSSTELTIPFLVDMGPPDPDVFYSSEGLDVIGALYEGLLQYKLDNSNSTSPLLATSWDVNASKTTYTFHLRAHVTFHDGTPFTSAAAKMSFERRVAVGGGPAYMLDAVASMDTPDPLTFIVNLKHPVSAFLAYLASPYGPRMMSPAVLTAHAGKNEAQTWLQNHDAGTGPYTIATWRPNQQYTLQRFPTYWGSPPAVATINIPIIPDILTQNIDLTDGRVDMIIHGLTPQQLSPFLHNSKYTVSSFASLQATMVIMNPNKGVMADPRLRAAVVQGIDRPRLSKEVFGTDASPANEVFPVAMLSGTGGLEPGANLKALSTAVKAVGDAGKKVQIAYDVSDPFNGRVADLLGTVLGGAGLHYTTFGMPDAQTYTLPSHPRTAPDILVVTTNPDAGHPDTWARIYMNTKGSTNYLSCSVPAADAAMDAGLTAVSPGMVEKDYEHVGDLLERSHCWDLIANVRDTIVARRGIIGVTHQLPANATIVFAKLKATA